MPDKPKVRYGKSVRIVRMAVLLLLTGVFLYSGYKAANVYLTGKNEEEAFTKLAELVVFRKKNTVIKPNLPKEPPADTVVETETTEVVSSTLLYYEMNPDFTGWLSVPNTKINYPVMFTPDEPERYLHRAFDGTYSFSGTPFIGADCDVESDCFIIYAHNMKNGAMFGTLDRYAKAEFCGQNPEFTFDTLYEERTYRVFSAFKGKIPKEGEAGFRWYDYVGNLDEAAFSELITEIENASLYKVGVKPVYGDQILLLSTCAYHAENGRFVVAAYRSVCE